MKIQYTKYTYPAVILVLILVLISCSTKKNRWTNRTYHGITAKYNILFNGQESFKAGIAELGKKAQENYTRVLPVYSRQTKEEATSISPQMDRTVEKSSKAIKKHSIFIKGKEYNKYIPYSYLMMGKAFFYKKDYETAQRTFNFILNNYKIPEITQEASIWLARTSSELGEMTRADLLFDELKYKFEKSNNKKIQLLFNMAYADFLIKQENYQAAIDPVQNALMIKMPKQVKTRLLYILAQLYQATGSMEAAYNNYKLVIKRNPKYEMAFNARINMAKCYSSGTGDKSFVIKELQKMLKDEKNKEYQDIIYYTLAEIDLMEPDEPSAIENLTLSVKNSTINNYQKSVSSLKLADIHFKNLNYTMSQRYYDTTMAFLPKDYPNYVEIKSKTEILTKLVNNLNVIQTQDSLQRIAKMTEPERNRFIDKLIEEYNEKERQRQEEERQRQMAIAQANMNKPPDATTAGNWYFYNPQAVAFGINEFRQKWGERKLEDNWRLSNKQLVTNTEETDIDNESDDGDTIKKPTDPKNRQTYIVNLPLTEEKIRKSDEMIVKAYYNVGFIYKDGLKDITKSNETFEKLIERFPDHALSLQSCFTLYQSYLEAKNIERSNYYKNIILTKYPNSDYAEIIKDPSYYKKIEARNKEGEMFYAQTFDLFNAKNYQQVIQNAKIASEKYAKNASIMARIDYLKTISYEYVYGRDSLISQLESYIVKYPTHQLGERCQVMLSSLKNKTSATTNNTTSTNVAETFTFDETDFHFYVFIADIRKANFNDMKVRISDFNKKYFSTLTFDVSSIYLDNTTQMITVSKFENKAKAMDYYNYIKTQADVMKGIKLNEVTQFIMSDKNYLLYYKNKNIRAQYPDFFKLNYSK